MNGKLRVLAIAGPTASGKSALALRLCKEQNGELISCDSMQIYRRMDIGTAKPSPAERSAVPHHLLDICEPNEDFSVADFAERARASIADVSARAKLPVLCGGTGLYLDAVLYGVQFGALQADEAYRAELMRFAEREGASALHALLLQKDPMSAAAIHPNNVRRVIRALEICRASGMTKTEWDKAALPADPPYESLVLALDYRDRELLYRRIDRRVRQMFEAGLVEEVRALVRDGLLTPDSTAGGAIGYKELLAYFDGSISLSDAEASICLATRHYAKRQLTWLRRRADVRWLYPDDYADENALAEAATSLLRQAFPPEKP